MIQIQLPKVLLKVLDVYATDGTDVFKIADLPTVKDKYSFTEAQLSDVQDLCKDESIDYAEYDKLVYSEDPDIRRLVAENAVDLIIASKDPFKAINVKQQTVDGYLSILVRDGEPAVRNSIKRAGIQKYNDILKTIEKENAI